MPKKPEPNLEALRTGGALLAATLQSVAAAAKPGVTLLELDQLAERLIRDGGGIPAFLGHDGFPATICASVNAGLVHGIPTDYKLVAGDLLKIDCGVKVDGWYTDSALTVGVGELSAEAQQLLDVTRQAVEVALDEARAGRTTGDLGAAVQAYVEGQGMNVARGLSGHGIGQKLHDDPSIPNFGTAGDGEAFTPGMVVAIEPMVMLGKPEIEVADDKWTITTRDGSLAAHFEETVMVTDGDPERFTPLPGVLHAQKAPGKLGKVT